jgi:hypothetical protein
MRKNISAHQEFVNALRECLGLSLLYGDASMHYRKRPTIERFYGAYGQGRMITLRGETRTPRAPRSDSR